MEYRRNLDSPILDKYYDYMMLAYHYAYLEAQDEDRTVSDKYLKTKVVYKLHMQIARIEEEGIEAYKKRCNLLTWNETIALHNLDQLSREVDSYVSNIRSRIYSNARIKEEDTNDIPKKHFPCTFGSVEEHLIYAYELTGDFCVECGVERNPSTIVDLMYEDVKRMGEMKGDGMIQANATFLRLSHSGAQRWIRKLLSEQEGVTCDEFTFEDMVDKIKELMITSIEKWAEEMKSC